MTIRIQICIFVIEIAIDSHMILSFACCKWKIVYDWLNLTFTQGKCCDELDVTKQLYKFLKTTFVMHKLWPIDSVFSDGIAYKHGYLSIIIQAYIDRLISYWLSL